MKGVLTEAVYAMDVALQKHAIFLGRVTIAELLAAVAPVIAAAERERCARVADAVSLSHHQDAAEISGWSVGDASICVARGNAAAEIAAAIRALGDADG